MSFAYGTAYQLAGLVLEGARLPTRTIIPSSEVNHPLLWLSHTPDAEAS
jgi:hypothetical protein